MPAVANRNKVKPKKSEGISKKPLILSNRNTKRTAKKSITERNEKGIIYVKHLPHGFFENQLRAFFSQFGNVTRVHVARSKKTLRSRGYAYVEFMYREVAQIAAETMSNYLMFGKLLKTGLLPAGAKRIPRKYEKAYDNNGNETTTYNLWLKKQVAKGNSRVTKTKIVNRNLRAVSKLKKLKEKYAKMGIDYNVDDVAPVYSEDDLKKPEQDVEEDKNRAKKGKKKADMQKKLKEDISADIGESSKDSSDDDEEAGFLSLESADWDVSMSDDDEKDDNDIDQENQLERSNKSVAVDFANKTKFRIDKEKKKIQKAHRPLVLRPPSSTDSSPEKTVSKKKVTRKVNEPLSKTEPDSSPEQQKKLTTKQKGDKNNIKRIGGITKKTKKVKSKDQKEISSPVIRAAKALLKDPSVKKTQAKDINKKKKKK